MAHLTGDRPLIDIGRITYKGGSVHVYLPKHIYEAPNIDCKTDSALVIVMVDNDSFLLVKDSAVIRKLKPKILEIRKKVEKLKLKSNF